MAANTPLPFSQTTSRWFEETFTTPTRVQLLGWRAIADGCHTLLLAPTGSGKTLAAFLYAIDRCLEKKESKNTGYRIVYVSPLKALAYDIERNLRMPLEGIQQVATSMGFVRSNIRVDIRTGDTPQNERQRQRRDPGDILITTPESLFLLIGSAARHTLEDVHTLIIDEIHSIAPTKRGSHLALTLERLCERTTHEPQRIGLSATQKPLEEIARFLGGHRHVTIIDTSERPRLDLRIVVPPRSNSAFELDSTVTAADSLSLATEQRGDTSLWAVIFPKLVEQINAHRSTILFVNNRRLCERLVHEINEISKFELCLPHHGSMSHAHRKIAEESLKEGKLKCIVATSSLELGIDMGAVDLVLLVESPGSVASGLQRVGRAGHGVGETSVGRIFPKFPDDLVECTVIADAMTRGDVESTHIPQNPLDVLAQHLVAICVVEPRTLDSLYQLVTRCASFRDLPRDGFVSVLNMLSGFYPSDEFADLRPRLVWDRESNVVAAKHGASTLVALNAGTIPDRGLYGVHIGETGPRIGELDEEMVYESRVGEVFMLGASGWKILDITRDRVIVEPAPGQHGKMPFWKGDGPGRPIEVGRAVGRFLGKLDLMSDDAARKWLQTDSLLDEGAIEMLVDYVAEQRHYTGVLPNDRRIIVERFRDEIGDWRVSILSPFGGRIHAPWALALSSMLVQKAGYQIEVLYGDSGISLRFADADELPGGLSLFPDPDLVKDLVTEQLSKSALFAGRFRENAGRALLLPKRRLDRRAPLWAQRIRARNLQAVASQYPQFPIILETYRECLRDVMDIPALVELLRAVQSKEIAVAEVVTAGPSPFSRSLVYAYVSQYLYESDAPLAERRAAALSLDRTLLRKLIGDGELRDLLDKDAISEVETELQHLEPERHARHPDALVDLVRRLGDLSDNELQARCSGDWFSWIAGLAETKRLIRVVIGGEHRWVAIEDAAKYRDALGCELPDGLPAVFLEPSESAVISLISRYCRNHGPVIPDDITSRYGLALENVTEALLTLERQKKLQQGGFRPDGTSPEWCDPDVLRRIRRVSLARLRKEIAPVENDTYCKFSLRHFGIYANRQGKSGLLDVLQSLEGSIFSFSDLESVILPVRMSKYVPGMLDELGTMGHIVWIGHAPMPGGDGKISIYLRDRIHDTIPSWTPYDPKTPLHADVLAALQTRGASFLSDVIRILPHMDDEQVMEVLWDLVWAGQVTNDLFEPLRLLAKPKNPSLQAQLRHQVMLKTTGRWSLVRELLTNDQSVGNETQRLLKDVKRLLNRYGIINRDIVTTEQYPGGFGSLYPVLKTMEESGQIRRGHFVAGLSGAQFALPAAVELLRISRDDSQDKVVVLSLVDPANPYGVLFPWPISAEGTPHTIRRMSGSLVALCQGRPLFVLEKSGERLVIFGSPGEFSEQIVLGLRQAANIHPKKALQIKTINGMRARTSSFVKELKQQGIRTDHQGVVVDVVSFSRAIEK